MSRRWIVAATLAFFVSALAAPLAVPAKPPKSTNVTIAGKVVPFSELAEKQDAKLDREAVPHWLALLADDGKIYTLFKDPGSRMFFKDKQLLNRPVQLTGRVFSGSQVLQVLSVRTVIKGEVHEPYYWCDVCKIKRFEANDCDCCGAPLEFREDPVKK